MNPFNSLLTVEVPKDVKAVRFEQFLVSVVLPFMAGHLFLGAVVYQATTHSETALLSAVVAGVVGAVLVLCRASGMLESIAASSVLSAVVFVLGPWPAALATSAAVVAYAVVLTRDRREGASAGLFFVHVPFISVWSINLPPELRLACLEVSLIAAGCLLLVRHRPAPAGLAVLGGLVAATIETGGLQAAPWYVAAVVAVLAVVGIFYESRRVSHGQSPLRRAAAQVVTVLLLLVVAVIVSGQESSSVAPMWLGLVVLAQGAQIARERGRDSVRLIWPAIATIATVWAVDWGGDWRYRALVTCIVVAALQVYALISRSRFVAHVSATLTAVPAVAAAVQMERGVFDHGGVAVQLLVTLLLLAHGLSGAHWRREYRWWRGFVPARHWRIARRFSASAVKALESIAIVGLIVKGLRAVARWVSYLNGGATLRITDWLYGASHVYGAWMFSTAVTAFQMTEAGASAPAAILAGQIAWLGWAGLVLLYGEFQDDPLSRHVGVLLACVPASTAVNWSSPSGDVFELWLLAATGSVLLVYTATRLRTRGGSYR